ncbi:MAG TPA: toll/interleukin-1 receptor domain-containing protein, partial [Pyrinomonadaceae bacterium]|nr:toll/interleukin-1 receptor domain-containing protein [Pyrinomonadaceae bacterium]
MSFEHDVFISYPHLSNKDDQSGQNGWVARFHNDLKGQLDDWLGRETRIWRDNKMAFGTVFGTAICERLQKAKVLLCVLSPAYVQSEWCLKELQHFRSLAPETGGLVIGDQSRIITVVKTPTEQQPEDLKDSLYCEFFEKTEDRGGVPRAFSQIQNGYKYEEYERKVVEVAWAIKRLLEGLTDGVSSEVNRTIYLAETSSDRDEDRLKVKNELEDRNYIVLPKIPHPTKTAGEYADAVRKDLELAFMSIHLFGGNYGVIPENADGKSIVQIQNELAAERSADDKSFKRVIWIPKNLANSERRQTEFLASLRNDEIALCG